MNFRFLFLFLLLAQTAGGQFYIKGRVTDIETELPLKGASVYINNSTKGTFANDNGEFELGPLQPGRYEVVVSFVGYQSKMNMAELKSEGQRISFSLNKKETTLNEVLILSSETRRKYLEIFKNNVLGLSKAAERSVIKNIEEVQFISGKNKDELLSFTDKELEIENPELGYTIYFELLEFYYNKANGQTYFYGYTRFVDWVKDEKTKRKYLHNRRDTYLGSTLHFFRSLLKKELSKEFFSVYQQSAAPKTKINTSQKNGTLTITTNQAQSSNMVNRIMEDSMFHLFSESGFRIYELNIKDGWQISYAKNSELKLELDKKIYMQGQPPNGTISGLRLRENSALVNEKGIVLTPMRLYYDGIWGYERLANMLPDDYETR